MLWTFAPVVVDDDPDVVDALTGFVVVIAGDWVLVPTVVDGVAGVVGVSFDCLLVSFLTNYWPPEKNDFNVSIAPFCSVCWWDSKRDWFPVIRIDCLVIRLVYSLRITLRAICSFFFGKDN